MSDTLSAIMSTGARQRTEAALFVGLAGDAPSTPPARVSLARVDRIDVGRGKRAITRRNADGAHIVGVTLDDARLSTQHARITKLGNAWIAEDLDSKNGTWIDGAKVVRKPLADGDVIVVGHTALVFRDTGGEAGDLDGMPAGVLATLSPALAARFDELARAAVNNVAIEITGETGTGKEIAARAVHALSKRTGRFVSVNCGALPATLLEGELFGHKKGAFTGATEDRVGLVRDADRGTLFLDEVAELPATSQAALLRVLQEGEVTPLGSDRPVRVDIRLVTATHANLDAAVDANKFRADLRARLLGVQLALPPLRERREDLGALVTALLPRPVTFAADAVAALYAYDWPLNIRELERALAAAAAVARDRIELAHLPPTLRAPVVSAPDESTLSAEDKVLRDRLVTVIDRHAGNLAAVARELGKDRTQIRRWMKRFGLSRDD